MSPYLACSFFLIFSAPTSRQVYGEFKSSMISEIVEKVPIRPGDKFIDLGSGATLSP